MDSNWLKWIQLVDAIPNYWQKTLTKNSINSQNLSYLNHHVIKSNRKHSAKKLTAKGLYFISSQHEATTPTSQKYIEKASRFDIAVETYLYSFTYYHNRLLSYDVFDIKLYTVPDTLMENFFPFLYFAKIILHFAHFVI